MINSRQNQHLKDIRRLRRCKDDRRAVLEGPHLLREALAADLAPDYVLATPGFLDDPAHQRWLAGCPRSPKRVDPRLLAEVTDADSPRGVVAVIDLRRGGAGELPRSSRGVYVYVDGMQDPGNLGALARVAEAAGASALALAPGTVSPNHPRALRASAGSLLRLPTAIGVAADDLDRHLESIAPRWLGLAPRDAADLYNSDLTPPLIVALGAEGPGLTPELESRIESRVTIPMAATVESLNATVAAALVLYEIRRIHLPAG